jgi:replication factor A1
MIVLDLEVLEELGECDKIGEPQALELMAEEYVEPQPTVISAHGFYENRPEQKAQPQHTLTPRRPPADSSHGIVYPIEGISIFSNKWTIKVRVTHKSEIKTWHNRNGEGKLFSVTLLDGTGEIKCTGFNDQCDAFHDVFQEGCVYYITTPCRVTQSKKQYSNIAHDYELSLERETIVEKVHFYSFRRVSS